MTCTKTRLQLQLHVKRENTNMGCTTQPALVCGTADNVETIIRVRLGTSM